MRSKSRENFPDTQWSLVGRARSEDDAVRQEALARILGIYSPALKKFLMRSRNMDVDVADDLVQGFIADKILQGNVLVRAKQNKGKLRNYLARSLLNFANSKWGHERSAQGEGIDTIDLEDRAASSARERYFDQEWAKQVVQQTLERMRQEYESGRSDIWLVFRRRLYEPLLHDAEPASYDELVAQLGIATPREAINLLATAKRGFERHLKLVIGEYVDGDGAIEAEIEELRRSVR